MRKRPSVLQLNKKYKSVKFFLSDLFGERCATLEDSNKARKVVARLRLSGYVVIYSGSYWHVFYKE